MATAQLRRRRPPRVPEKTEQAHIVQLLRSIAGAVYVIGTVRRRGDHPGTMQTAGLADVLAFLDASRVGFPGKRFLLFIECKAAGGRLRPEQLAFQQLCREAEIAHIVGGLDAVIAWLTRHGYLKAESVPHYRQPPASEGR